MWLGLEIATDMVANVTNIFSFVTKNSGLVATLATRFLYDLDLNQKSIKVETNIFILSKKRAKSHKQSQFTPRSDGSHSCVILLHLLVASGFTWKEEIWQWMAISHVDSFRLVFTSNGVGVGVIIRKVKTLWYTSGKN